MALTVLELTLEAQTDLLNRSAVKKQTRHAPMQMKTVFPSLNPFTWRRHQFRKYFETLPLTNKALYVGLWTYQYADNDILTASLVLPGAGHFPPGPDNSGRFPLGQ